MLFLCCSPFYICPNTYSHLIMSLPAAPHPNFVHKGRHWPGMIAQLVQEVEAGNFKVDATTGVYCGFARHLRGTTFTVTTVRPLAFGRFRGIAEEQHYASIEFRSSDGKYVINVNCSHGNQVSSIGSDHCLWIASV